MRKSLEDIMREHDLRCEIIDEKAQRDAQRSERSDLPLEIEEKDAKEQKYVAFDTTKEAKEYVRSIRNYNELNLFDFKTQTRRELQFLVEPLHK